MIKIKKLILFILFATVFLIMSVSSSKPNFENRLSKTKKINNETKHKNLILNANKFHTNIEKASHNFENLIDNNKKTSIQFNSIVPAWRNQRDDRNLTPIKNISLGSELESGKWINSFFIDFVDSKITRFNFEHRSNSHQDWKIDAVFNEDSKDVYQIDFLEPFYAKDVRINIFDWENINPIHSIKISEFAVFEEKQYKDENSNINQNLIRTEYISATRTDSSRAIRNINFNSTLGWSPSSKPLADEYKNTDKIYVEINFNWKEKIKSLWIEFSEHSVKLFDVSFYDKDNKLIFKQNHKIANGNIARRSFSNTIENVKRIRVTLKDWIAKKVTFNKFEFYALKESKNYYSTNIVRTIMLCFLIAVSIISVSFFTFCFIKFLKIKKSF